MIRPRLLTAEAGVAVFKVAFEPWVAESNDRELAVLLRETLAGLRVVANGR